MPANIKKEDEDEEAETGGDEDENIPTTYHPLPDSYLRKLISGDDPNLDKGST